MLKTVPREPTLTERAETQIEALVLDRTYQPGEKLPSENEMGRLLRVSRTVVREAVRKLVARGLLEARNGSGIYARELGASVVRQPIELLMRGLRLSPEQLAEVREAIEVKIAGLAAERAQLDDIRGLEETVERVKRKNLSREELVEADLAFNHRLAAATHNPLFEALSDAVGGVLRQFVSDLAAENGAAARAHSVEDHQRILDRVKARDVAGARRAAEVELAKARTLLKRAGAPATTKKAAPRPRRR